MANKRFLPCRKKEVLAFGEPLSIADCREKVRVCFECKDFCFCVLSQETFKHIIKQQNILNNLTKEGLK